MRKQRRTASKLVSRELVMASIENMPEMGTEWLWPERIAMDSVTLLVGEAGVGKSAVAADIAARVSSGSAWPDGKSSPGAGGVMVFNANEHLIRKVRPALRGAGADLSRCKFPYLTAEKREDDREIEEIRKPINFKRDLELLAQALEAAPECKLVIIDPFMAFMGSGAGADNPDVVSVLRTLHGLAVQYHVAILVITHLRDGNGPAKSRVAGGEDLMTMARAIWMVAEDGGQRSEVGGQKSDFDKLSPGEIGGERRVLLGVKNNMAPERTGLAFELMQEDQEKAPRLVWSSERIEMTADEALREMRQKTTDSTSSPAVEKAKEFLTKALANGPRLVKDVEMEAKQIHGISQGSLLRGRIALKVHAFRTVVPGAWWVELEKEEIRNSECEIRSAESRNGEAAIADLESADESVARVECLGEKSEFGSRNSEVKEPTADECVARVECLEGKSEFGSRNSEVKEPMVDECVARVECLGEKSEVGRKKLSVAGLRQVRRVRPVRQAHDKQAHHKQAHSRQAQDGLSASCRLSVETGQASASSADSTSSRQADSTSSRQADSSSSRQAMSASSPQASSVQGLPGDRFWGGESRMDLRSVLEKLSTTHDWSHEQALVGRRDRVENKRQTKRDLRHSTLVGQGTGGKFDQLGQFDQLTTSKLTTSG